jgi:hypothetical protein
MSGTTPSAQHDFSAAAIIGRLEAGEYPPEVVANIAAGFLPLAQDDLIAVLAFLATSGDEATRTTARMSLGEVPPRSMNAFATSESVPPEHLEFLLRATNDPPILEALIRNRAVRDDAVEELARRADAQTQEVIVINQARILRSPQLLDALESNPALTADVKRRVLETREEFFDKKARQEAAAAEAAALAGEDDEDEARADLPNDAIADLLEKAALEDAAGTTAPAVEPLEFEKKDAKKMSIFAQILTMTVSEKVQLAFKGGRSERLVLVRERNRLIASAVMRNPRMTEQEVESIAGMRNVDDEVMRLIAFKREWMAKYSIVLTMARNPKVPIGIVLPLINRLTLRDLKGLKDDKGVTEAVRAAARKAFALRSQKS